MTETICVYCKKVYRVKRYRVEVAKYCSYKCYWENKKGNVLPNSGQFQAGHRLNKGKPRPDMVGNKLSVGRTPHNKDKREGNKVRYLLIENNTYDSLHYWVRKHNGKPSFCEECNSTKNVEWANKSGKYLKDLTDWIRLCRTCHRKHDSALRLSL
jgi:hypothetical protein